jgi:transposase-like protein
MFIKYNLISKKEFCIFQDNNDSNYNVIQIYLQAKSLKIYTGLLGGSGV